MMTSRSRKLLRTRISLCLLAALGIGELPATATAGTVADCTHDSGAGTLRNVITAAANGETVDASACTNSTITLSSEIAMTQTALTIVGPGDDSLTISANHLGRAFDQTAGDLTLQHLRIADGATIGSSAFGGCVYAAGDLTLQHATISGCSATATSMTSIAAGGGAFSRQTLTLVSSTISGNSATASGAYSSANGGGVYGFNGVTAQDSSITSNIVAGHYSGGGGVFLHKHGTIVATTIDANAACGDIACTIVVGRGGGLYAGGPSNNPAYDVTITDSTISGNTAGIGGGCYCGFDSDEFRSSTIAFNTAYAGGGVFSSSNATIDLQSTIIADNAASTDADLHLLGSLSGASANNLIPYANMSPPGTLVSDPQLGPLSNHGGPTRTHSINPASAAVDTGNNAAMLATDQRGATRVVGIGADIGAYERQPADDEVFYGGFDR